MTTKELIEAMNKVLKGIEWTELCPLTSSEIGEVAAYASLIITGNFNETYEQPDNKYIIALATVLAVNAERRHSKDKAEAESGERIYQAVSSDPVE